MYKGYQTNKGIFSSLDWITIGLYVVLLIWGWFSVCGASYDFSNPNVFGFGSNSGKQMIWICTSFILASALLMIVKRFYYNAATFIYVLMIFVLILTIFIAPDTKGSRSWIPIGSSIKLQPAEFAKFAVALAIGKYMDRYGLSLTNMKEFAKVVGMIIFPMLLIIAQKETGTALVYLAFFLVLYREGMSGSALFAAFSFVVYFVVGLKYEDEYITDMPVSIGEFTVLILSYVFTVGLMYRYERHCPKLTEMVIGGIVINIFAYLFSAFVIPFNVCIVQILVNIGLMIYIGTQYIYDKKFKHLLITIKLILK